MRRPTTAAQQERFLAAYASTGVITSAAVAAKIDRHQHYDWLADREKYPDYEARFKEAHAKACDRLVEAAVKRGVDGWDEPVFGKGPGPHAGTKKISTIRRYSDRLLEVLLKAKIPHEFRERISIGGDELVPPIKTENMDAAKAAELYRSKLKRPA